MKYAKISFLHKLIADNLAFVIMPCLLRELQCAISDKNTLFLGFGGTVLDFLDNGKLFYAVPKGYEITRWPKIRPFKTVVVDVNALPFCPKTFEIVVINHYLEFSDRNIKFLQEVFRVLKPEGRLLAVTLGKQNTADFRKNIRSINEIITDIAEASFCISSIWGANKKARFFSYDFNRNRNRLRELLLEFLQLLSSVIVITADKRDVALESIFAFE